MQADLVSDNTLTEALLRNDAAAWERFFEAYDPVIVSIVSWPKWHFDFHTRQDVAQGIRLAITRSVDRLKDERALPAFVKRICFHHCIDRLRRRIREERRWLPLGEWDEDGEWQEREPTAGPAFDPVAELVRGERAAAVRRALAELDAPSRGLIREFYAEGLSYRDLSEKHRIPINTVGSRLSRGLEKLRARLSASDDPPQP
ncbi:MAG: sigma-70 family RNA polymerase sigma factor [Kiritimatiellia bacterium]|nr:sigma-70 family RNA polymerase sigma factor [Kiritimatiellia bacterium]